MATISIRMKKTSNVSGRVAHDFRKKIPSYADPKREKLNVTLLGNPIEQDALRQELEKLHLEKTGRQRRKDSALIYEGIITFSTDADLTNREDFDQAALDLLEQIAEKHGFNEPLWLVRHEDESRPHYHFAFANAHAENAKPVRMSPNDMRQLQDLAGQCFKHLGLTRGKSKEQRIAENEPMHKIINRSVRQLHNDLPKEIAELEKKIEELTEKERKNAERLEKTLQKLTEASETNKKLQKRAETYEKRLETVRDDLRASEAEIERLKKLVEPQKPKPQKILAKTGEKETGFFFKKTEPILKPATVFTQEALEKALLSTRKAAEEEAKRKARNKIRALEIEKEEAEKELKKEQEYRNFLLEALENAGTRSRLESVKSPTHLELPYDPLNPPEIVRYRVTMLDYGTKIVAIGDGTPSQIAAALYAEARERRWESAVFSGMDEAQIEWLVQAAAKDGYKISFKEPWAEAYAEKIKEQTTPKSSHSRDLEL